MATEVVLSMDPDTGMVMPMLVDEDGFRPLQSWEYELPINPKSASWGAAGPEDEAVVDEMLKLARAWCFDAEDYDIHDRVGAPAMLM